MLSDPTILNATGDQYRLYAANFDGTPGAGVYLQAVGNDGSSSISWNSATTASCTETHRYNALGRLSFVSACNGTSTNYTYGPGRESKQCHHDISMRVRR